MATRAQIESQRSSLIPGLAFGLFVLASIGLFVVPAFIIRPFRPQAPAALSLALAVRQQAPMWTLMTAGAALVLAFMLWRRIATWRKAFLVLGVCLASVSAVMARVDYFEWMFHPVVAPGFESAERAQLEPSQMVMAVRFGNDSRAYPIRAMAYHHVVNDVVGGVPIAVTY